MSQNDEFKVKFRGIRGSHPTPSHDRLKYGGNTVCIEINVNGHLIIIDAGTGIINLGNDLVKSYIASGTCDKTRTPIKATVLISHCHLDHIQGFPFFKPAYLNTSKLYIFGAQSQSVGFKECLTQNVFTSYFPVGLREMAADLQINDLTDSEMILLYPDNPVPEVRRINTSEELDIDSNVVVITSLKCHAHPRDGVLIFKISWKNHNLVYATDKESYIGGDMGLVSFARNADILIHDAQYTHDDYCAPVIPKQGFGHSTPEMAIEIAKLANAKKLILFHIDPTYDDAFVERIEENARKVFPNSMVASEDLEIDILCPQSLKSAY